MYNLSGDLDDQVGRHYWQIRPTLFTPTQFA